MKISKFRVYKALIAAMLGIAVAVAICTDTAIIALMAVIIAIVLALILEHRNREIVRDERISHISGKAASASFNSVIIMAAAASLTISPYASSRYTSSRHDPAECRTSIPSPR